MDYYKDRLETQKEDTQKAKDYISKYRYIMKSDKLTEKSDYNLYEYIHYILKNKCKLNYDYSIIRKHLIFRYFICPFILASFVYLSISLILLSLMLYIYFPSIITFIILSIIFIAVFLLLNLVHYEELRR